MAKLLLVLCAVVAVALAYDEVRVPRAAQYGQNLGYGYNRQPYLGGQASGSASAAAGAQANSVGGYGGYQQAQASASAQSSNGGFGGSRFNQLPYINYPRIEPY